MLWLICIYTPDKEYYPCSSRVDSCRMKTTLPSSFWLSGTDITNSSSFSSVLISTIPERKISLGNKCLGLTSPRGRYRWLLSIWSRATDSSELFFFFAASEYWYINLLMMCPQHEVFLWRSLVDVNSSGQLGMGPVLQSTVAASGGRFTLFTCELPSSALSLKF